MTPSPDPVVTLASAHAATGRLLGDRYELGTLLGQGGMGVVYQALDTTLNRTVAVKVFRDETSEIARTASETQLLAGLNHPALVTLFDAHIGEGEPRYLVMEYIDGPTLESRLTRGPLSARSAARIARDLSEALHTVHTAGIVHRDIKPANVLLRPSRVPGEEFHAKLADFGIAYLVDSTRLTMPGSFIGSAAYLSPEQVTGSPPLPASDVYSLGLVLLEALTGQRAFAQTGLPEAALARLTQDPTIPSFVGHDWGALLTRMTARDPALRPSTLDLVVSVARLTNAAPDEAATTVVADAHVGGHSEARTRIEDSPTLVAPMGVELPLGRTNEQTTVHIDVGREASEADGPPRGQRTPWHRRMLPAAGAAVAAVALIVGAFAWGAFGGGRVDPAPPPELPALEEPLSSHLQQLLDSVSP